MLLPPQPPLGPGFAEWYQDYKRSKEQPFTKAYASHKRRPTFRTDYAFTGIDRQRPVDKSSLWKTERPQWCWRPGSPSRFAETLPASSSAPSLRASSPEKTKRRTGPPPPLGTGTSRWWLSEVTGDRKVCQGLFEVRSGLVPMYDRPSKDGELLGNLRGGTMFKADTKVLGKVMWLKLITEGVPPPLFSLERDGIEDHGEPPFSPSSVTSFPGADAEPADTLGTFERLYKRSTRGAMHAKNELDPSTTIWVEFNQQYIVRKRDLTRQKQSMVYGICSCPTSFDGLRRGRRSGEGTGTMSSSMYGSNDARPAGSNQPPLNRTSSAFS